MKKLTIEQIKTIPALKDQGETTKTIAEKYNVSTFTIRNWVKALRAKGYVVKNDKRGAKAISIDSIEIQP